MALVLVGLCLRAESPANPRFTGTPFLSVWTPDEYGAHPENHCVVQHPATGFIYVGNGAGLLEFDGVAWQLIPAPGNAAVRALAIDRAGRIWGSSNSDIFRLESAASGQRRLVSQLDRVPPAHRQVSNVVQAFATAEGVWFRGQKDLILFGDDPAPARVWQVATGTMAALRLWLIGDEPHVSVSGNRVFRIRQGELEPVPGLNANLWAARALDYARWLAATPNSVAVWDGERLTPRTERISADGTQAATFLADGRIAFGTVREGVVVCDPDGRRLQRIDRSSGLPGNVITAVMEDRQGGLWATLLFGLVRIQLDSPYARHGPSLGLEGNINSLATLDGRLYAGGSEGIARRENDGRFQPVRGIPGPDRQMVAHDGWLFSLSFRLRGFRPAVDTAASQLENRNYYGLLPLSGHPGWFAHGSNEGLRWAGFVDGKWTSRGPVKGPSTPIQALLAAPANVVWANNRDRLLRFDFSSRLDADIPHESFGPAEGLSAPASAMFMLGSDPVAIADGRLLRFDAAKRRFEPETRITGLDQVAVRLCQPAEDGTLWLLGGQDALRVHRVTPVAGGRWHAEPLAGSLHRLAPRTVFEETATRTLWIGAHGTLISRDLAWKPSHAPQPAVARISSFSTEERQLIQRLPLPAPGAARAPLSLAADTQAVRFAFSAASFVPDHTGASHLEFRSRLGGLEHQWTKWSKETHRDFTNLPWRKFILEVQARDGEGRAGPIDRLEFRVLSPWWAGPWALGAYGVLGAAGLVGVIRFRTRLLQRRNRRLEETVSTRTRELAEEKAQLAASAAELARLGGIDRAEKIAAQLGEEKARLEVLRYQLNPHFLYNSLNSIYGLLYESPAAAAQMVLRLSDFCRATLTPDPAANPSLGAQCTTLRLYLEVEKVRWGDSLEVTFDIAPDAATVPLPPFLLLPLVENAVKYGGRTSPDKLGVRLSAHLVPAPASAVASAAHPEPDRSGRGSLLIVEIANTGRWVEPANAKSDSSQIGLENFRQRLQRAYPGAHTFTTSSGDGWVVARLTLQLPLHPSATGDAASASPP